MKPAKLLLFIILVTGCKRESSAIFQQRLNVLADRSCRAINIRNQRFELALKIRKLQDTLATTKRRSDSTQLQAYLRQKDALFNASIRLADTIHKQLDSLIPYNDKAAEKRFSAQLHALLIKKGCKDIDQ